MRIAVLAANGRTGRELVAQAGARGHQVVAVSRRPDPEDPASVGADATDPIALEKALQGVDVVVSAVGLVAGSPPDLLTKVATALIAATNRPSIWLGSFGIGASAIKANRPSRAVVKLALGREIPDKVNAERIILDAGGTVVHAGPLTGGPVSRSLRVVPLDQIEGRVWFRPNSRATVAVAMLDATEPHWPGAGGVAVIR
ncbi:NAD(P)H-binding protein [Kineosporia rhizophila]|uniref:NAD(P)-dependent oxidoreductase n=1 Tax=Kineosporia rhizophila TaxID=84633 RepID=UPI001E4080E4|nr:NAD(P)H-binding protein [Kineosporia rhizophila]MCE0538530.1 NAD(P)H-binding protein [Kineosporia rhizophila]